MEKTKVYYTTVLKVKSPKNEYTWPDTEVSETKTVKGRTVAYDLWTYFFVYNKDDTGFAAAAPCAYDADTGRPIVGYFELNLNAIAISPANLINQMGTFVHEFYHILVFNNQLFDKFIDSTGNLVFKPIAALLTLFQVFLTQLISYHAHQTISTKPYATLTPLSQKLENSSFQKLLVQFQEETTELR